MSLEMGLVRDEFRQFRDEFKLNVVRLRILRAKHARFWVRLRRTQKLVEKYFPMRPVSLIASNPRRNDVTFFSHFYWFFTLQHCDQTTIGDSFLQ